MTKVEWVVYGVFTAVILILTALYLGLDQYVAI